MPCGGGPGPPRPPGGAVTPAVPRRMLRAGSAGPAAAAAERRRWVRGYGAGGRGAGLEEGVGIGGGGGGVRVAAPLPEPLGPSARARGRPGLRCPTWGGEVVEFGGGGGEREVRIRGSARVAGLGAEPSALPALWARRGWQQNAAQPPSPFPSPCDVGGAVGGNGTRGPRGSFTSRAVQWGRAGCCVLGAQPGRALKVPKLGAQPGSAASRGAKSAGGSFLHECDGIKCEKVICVFSKREDGSVSES